MDDIQKQQFQARLKRIAGGAPNTMHQIYVGPAEEVVEPNAKGIGGGSGLSLGMLYPLTIVMALAVGVLSVVFSRYIRFELLGGELTGPNADIWMAADVIVATFFLILTRALLSARGWLVTLARTVGLVATLLLMHNAVHIAPGPFSRLFSPEWVDEVIVTTEPMSVLFRGVSYTMPEPAPKAPEMPTVLRLN